MSKKQVNKSKKSTKPIMTYSNVKKQSTSGASVSGRRYKTGLGY